MYRPQVRALDLSQAGELPGALSRPHEAGTSDATAWVCTGTSCLPSIHTLETLESAIAASR
jgi:uncharacterized protein YyaL (SSP411 family)